MLITDGSFSLYNYSSKRLAFLETVSLAVSSRVEFVQIREKLLPALLVYEMAVDAVALASGSPTKILVNERYDVALAAGADGVHLTSTSIPVDVVRSNVPNGFVVGVSAHSLAEVEQARNAGADYALLGPVFATPGKGEPIGVGGLREACGVVSPFPVIAVGGIDASNASLVFDAGAAGFAAIRYLNEFVRISQ